MCIVLIALGRVNAMSQQLYALTSSGGKGFGALISLPVGGNTLSYSIPLDGASGYAPANTHCTEAPNGKLYGTTVNGGLNGQGVIFEYDPANSLYTEVYHFAVLDGSGAVGSFLLASNGKLYGTAFSGGIYNGGTLFEFDYTTYAFVKLHDFNTSSIYFPALGELTEHAPGVFIGVTQFGGSSNAGGIFEFDLNTNTYTVKTNIDQTTGLYGIGSLVKAGNNLYYSSTMQGGLNGLGVLYSYDYLTNTITKVYDCDFVGGGSCVASLLHEAGKLYGVTATGGANNGGAIFEFAYNSNTYSKLYDFAGITGYSPFGCPLIKASNGLLYGTANQGGPGGSGVLYSFQLGSNTYTMEMDMPLVTGVAPSGGVIEASNGKMYGLTTGGGKSTFGCLYEYDYNLDLGISKVDFRYAINGSYPFAGMVKAPNNKLYGCCTFNGANDGGTLFEFDPLTQAFVKKFDFGGVQGMLPHNTMILASDGNLYGTAHIGGANSAGVIYRYDYINDVYSKLYDFPAGSNAPGNLIEGPGGMLYGTTWYGGANGFGMLYQFDFVNNILTSLHDFAGPDGSYSFGHPTLVGTDRLFGLTESGGLNGNGILYEYNLTTNTFVIHHHFNGTDGNACRGSLIEASNGKLYATGDSGGANGYGTIFEFDPVLLSFAVKYDLTSVGGGQPIGGSMYEASNNKLYGLNIVGGTNGVGTIFEYDYILDTYTKLVDFSSSTGSTPYYSQFAEANPCIQPTVATAGVTTATICAGDNTTMQVLSGSLNDATTWQWYSGTCGGTPVGTGTNLVVSPGITSTYYVRGEGGCVTPAGCSNAVTVTVNAPITWWLNADGDNYAATSMLACSSPGAGWTNTAPMYNGDCNDSNPLIPSLTEICGNNIDDNCNGQTDEACGGPNVDLFANAPLAPVSGGAYPGGNCYPNSLVGATVSPEGNPANVLLTGGQDHWYKFVAQSTAARFVCSTSAMNVVLELHNAATVQIDVENDVSGNTGGEIMVSSGLTVGATYYLAVRSFDGVLGPYTICLQMLMPSYCADGSGSYDLCSNFKPAYTGANTYTFNFTPTGITPGVPTSITAVGQIALSSPALALRHLGTYNVVINANFTLFDAASNNESITVPGISICAISIAAHPDEQVKLAQRCPASIFKGTTLQAKPFVCGATNHTVQFTEVSDCMGTSIIGVPFMVNTSGASSNINLNSVGGVQAGKWYAVSWRPNFVYGPGQFGTAQYIQVVSSSDEIEQGDDEIQPESELSTSPLIMLYPNPSNGCVAHIAHPQFKEDRIKFELMDARGVVIQQGTSLQNSNGSYELIFVEQLASGIYFLRTICANVAYTSSLIVQ